MNGLTLLAIIALAVGVVVAYRAGTLRGGRVRTDGPHPLSAAAAPPAASPSAPSEHVAAAIAHRALEPDVEALSLDGERARLVRAYEREISTLSRRAGDARAEQVQLRAFAEERRALFGALADARAETARYRDLVIDLEDNAPSRFLDGPGSADDLKLIVGVGPVLERMLHQLGVTTYRQIARWSERDIDEFDRRLPEFPGRIRRDAWVTQARELHHSKYGVTP